MFFFFFILYLLSLFTFLFIDRLLEKEKVVIEEVKAEALNCAKERERVLQTKLDQLHTETTQKGDLTFLLIFFFISLNFYGVLLFSFCVFYFYFYFFIKWMDVYLFL